MSGDEDGATRGGRGAYIVFAQRLCARRDVPLWFQRKKRLKLGGSAIELQGG